MHKAYTEPIKTTYRVINEKGTHLRLQSNVTDLEIECFIELHHFFVQIGLPFWGQPVAGTIEYIQPWIF